MSRRIGNMPPEMAPTLSVIVPVYNERPTVGALLRRVIDVPIAKEIIVIDDCSTDGSDRIVEELAAREPSIRFIRQERNQEKARRCAADSTKRAATSSSCRTPISNTTRAITRRWCSRSSKETPTSSTARASPDIRAG